MTDSLRHTHPHSAAVFERENNRIPKNTEFAIMVQGKVIVGTTIMVAAAWAGVEASKTNVVLPGGQTKVVHALLHLQLSCP